MNKFKIVFLAIALVFVVILAVVTCYRGGKDLKVGLYGVEQVLQKHSPYDNPTDPKRPIFRYAPAFTILQRPFLLKSKMTVPFEFDNIAPSILMWYFAEIIALIISALILLKLIPAPSRDIGLRNLLVSFLLAMPLIAYELVNCQNKIIALAFILAGIYLFEKKKYFLSSVLFNLAVIVYIPLIFFIIYFVLRGRIKYALAFISAFLLIFIIIPSVVLGYSFNNFLLKDWFVRCLKPFSFTISYATYLELRISSQSLPSAIGRLFVSGLAADYRYAISPSTIHMIIRFFSASIIIFTIFASWKRQRPAASGLIYSIFLILALLLPSYCLWYTWAWLFVVYFAVLNYTAFPEVSALQKKILFGAAFILLMGSYSSAVKFLNTISVLFWSTVIFWAGSVAILLKNSYKAYDKK
jgi:hypothetical protein